MIVKFRDQQIRDWESDYRLRANPELMNELLYVAVPVLKACEWQITRVEPGYCESLLPLNHATTNQHGTHQAALISLSADYTGGMAFTTLLRGVPLAGIHRCHSSESASLWLAAMNVKYLNPSTGHLIGRCRVPQRQQEMIGNRYAQGKRVIATLDVEFESNGQRIAEATMTYFAQPTSQLLESGNKTSTLFNQKLKASARLIAGIRASTHQVINGKQYRVDCPYSALAAGPQGEMLAQRLKQALPQLSDMIVARTQHIDDLLESIPNLRQVVLVGAGLDMRPFQLVKRNPDLTFIDVDLPVMLAERQRVISQLRDGSRLRRVEVAADFLYDDLAAKLRECPQLNPDWPTAFIYEGCSMYFEPPINRKVLKAIRSVMRHPDSRLWCDFVTSAVVEGRTEIPEVMQFLKSMEELGESFIFGHDRPEVFLSECGFHSPPATTVMDFRAARGLDASDPAFAQYQFAVGR